MGDGGKQGLRWVKSSLSYSNGACGQTPSVWLRTRRIAPLLSSHEGPDAIEISDEYMIATIDGHIVVTARWSWYAARQADRSGETDVRYLVAF